MILFRIFRSSLFVLPYYNVPKKSDSEKECFNVSVTYVITVTDFLVQTVN